MDFIQMSYLITIVESNFNLSVAAKKIPVSQSALSKVINKLEIELEQELFVRHKGRLVDLTPTGRILYESALEIDKIYTQAMLEIEQASAYQFRCLRVGINPLFLSTVFTPAIIQLIERKPDLRFELIEKSDIENQQLLDNNELDFAFLVDSNMPNSNLYEKVKVYSDKLSLFLDKNHPLAKQKKLISWKDLNNLNVAIANSNFIIHKQTIQKFADYQIRPNIMLQGATSAYLLQAMTHTDVVTILPKPVKANLVSDDIVILDFDEPLKWTVSMVYPKKDHRSSSENYFIKHVQTFFKNC